MSIVQNSKTVYKLTNKADIKHSQSLLKKKSAEKALLKQVLAD